MLKLLRYLKQYKKQTILGPIFKLIEALLELSIPLIMAVLIDDGIGKKDTSLIFFLGGAMLIIILTGALCAFICQYFASIAGQGFGTNLRNACFKKVSSLSYSQLDNYPPSKIMTRMTSDINQVQLGVSLTIRLATRIPFLLIFGMIMAMIVNLKLGLILLCAIPVFCLAAFLIMRKTFPQFKKVQAKLDKINKNIKENLSGQRVIRAFNNQEAETEEFLSHNKNYKKEVTKSGILSSLFGPLSLLILNISVVLIIYLGGIQINSLETSQGQIIAFINYVFLILQSLVVLSNVMPILVKMVSSSSRVLELLEISEEKEEFQNTGISDSQFDYSKPAIEFKNTVFNYQTNGENEIRNISFIIERGQNVGLIGPTGSGKTTLVNLLQGFYKLDEGEILIHGVNINDINKNALQKLFGVVPQKVMLLADTISNNIKMGTLNATKEDISLACSIAQADKFIETLEKQYETVLKVNGSNLSGGQRQRLTIARAVINKPQILILDDSSSALDYLTESKLKKAIKKNLIDTTVINITQRVNSVKDCDIILVLNNGKLEAIGTHNELIKTSQTYNEFYKAQNL
ncbi:MAG: ABC transporter ATP-binding protein/permease [Firmicutes bacterium]|nr:ABC transporter ATP-binding protein/permease [Bacillota bacterium]